jgi:ABC-2 type transport system permease protein
VIARKTWREILPMAVAYTLILEALLIPAVLLWPEVRQQVAAIGKLLPMEILKRAFEGMNDPNPTAAYRAYMAVQMFFKGVNIVGLACAVLLGTGIVARERENQTLEFLLARPVSRSRVLWAKYWPIALAVLVPIFLTSWSAIPLSEVPSVRERLPFDLVTLAAFHNACFVLLILNLTVLASIRMRTQVHVAFVVGAVIVVQVALYFIQKIRVASLFNLSDFDVYGPILAGNVGFGELFLAKTVWLLAGSAIAYVAADLWLRKSDL